MARLSAAFVVCFWRASGAFGFWGFREVFGLHEDVLQDEEKRQDVHHGADLDRKSTRLNSSHTALSRMPSSA